MDSAPETLVLEPKPEENVEFNLGPYLISFLMENTFYAEMSRHITKISNPKIQTACIMYDLKNDILAMHYNPRWFRDLANECNLMVLGLLEHEFNHVVLCHLTGRRLKPNWIWAIATDLANNSIIVDNYKDDERIKKGGKVLPECGFIPGHVHVAPPGSPVTPLSIALDDLVLKMPPMMSSEWYYNEIKEKLKPDSGDKNQDGLGSVEVDNWLDDHDSWEELSDEAKALVSEKIKSIIQQAVRRADQTSTGWGKIPAWMREEIRKSVTSVVNWRAVLKQFVGSLLRGSKKTSIKVINRRYPYIHPGTQKGYVAKLLIAEDQSGSVSDEMLTTFFGELSSLTKNVEVDFVPFDSDCDEKDAVRWKKGTKHPSGLIRQRCGGTDFSAPTKMFNDPKNRGRWDALVILTDGQAGIPVPCRGKRAWVLGEGCRLAFPSNELQISLTRAPANQGDRLVR